MAKACEKIAIIVKDGPGFIVSLEVTLQTKEQVLGKQITARQLTFMSA